MTFNSDELSIYRADRYKEGSCNACTYKDGHRKVWVIRLGMTEIRLCDRHASEIAKHTRHP